MKHYGDITKINGTFVEPVNVVIGGSPCQDLSIAGKRAGLEGERSGLFMEQLRIIKEMRKQDADRGRTEKDIRPRFMVWENVPGAFSSNKGEDFGVVLQETIKVVCEKAPVVPKPKNGWPTSGCLTDVDGKWSLAWRVFDAQFWGVPQRRRRIALIADFGGLSAPEILFERKGVSGYIKPCGTQGQSTPGNIETCFNTAGSTGGAYCIQGNCIDRADTAGCNGKGWTEGVSYTLNTIDRPAVLPFACNQRDEARLLGDKAVALQAQPGMKQQTFLVSDSNPFVPSPPQSKDAVVFEPGSCSRVGGHIWQDGKTPSLRADPGDNHPAIVLENHPADSRVKIAEDGVVQTLNARMGTGGGNTPMVLDRLSVGSETLIVEETKGFPLGFRAENTKLYDETATTICNGTRPGWCNGLIEADGENAVVRRLTPLECERLQGFPDGWTDIGEWVDTKGKVHKESTDSARYKALGNSIAIPPWFYVLQRISAFCGTEATMASLFDGIGGFPLIWERINGKGSCLWASEIEDFPIAVTKRHFPDEVPDE